MPITPLRPSLPSTSRSQVRTSVPPFLLVLLHVLESLVTNISTGRIGRATFHVSIQSTPSSAFSSHGKAYLWHLRPMLSIRAHASHHKAYAHNRCSHDRCVRSPIRWLRVPVSNGQNSLISRIRGSQITCQPPEGLHMCLGYLFEKVYGQSLGSCLDIWVYVVVGN